MYSVPHFGIFAYCEQCLWKIYHVYNLIVCRMTGAVPPLLWYKQNFFAFTTKKTFGSLLLYLSLVFFCCKTNRKSNWQLSWEMKGTKSFFWKKVARVATCIQMRTYTQQLLFRRNGTARSIFVEWKAFWKLS